MRRHHLPADVLVALGLLVLSGCSGDDATPAAGSPPSSRASATTTIPRAEHRLDATLRVDQIQELGSHNSYKAEPYPEVLDSLRGPVPATVVGLEYFHRPLTEQFDDLGVRQIELDVWADPQGGLYAQPPYPASVGVSIPDDPAMRAPGFKVLHAINFDTHVTCATLVICLTQLRDWSDAHPGHAPMLILLEVKDESADAAELEALDAEIRSVFSDDQMITPDDVRGEFPTLGAAVRERGWPTLGEARGKVIFGLDNAGLRDVYVAGHPSLEGRPIFTPSAPGNDDAAFAKLNDPIADADAITAALAANMIIRTRADADTIQARSNDTTMRDAAIASGAQFVSTDYMEPNLAFSDYSVAIPGGTPARCNPVTAPANCQATDVEDPKRLDP